MIVGLSIADFTLVHVVISLIAIVSGLVVTIAMIGDRHSAPWTTLFLLTTILTSVTGFMFPADGFSPARAVGLVSLAALAVTLVALYAFRLSGIWRPAYVVSVVLALYLNFFVLVVQGFQKISFLQPLAPTQSEPPFKIAQAAVLIIFIALGFFAVRRFRPR